MRFVILFHETPEGYARPSHWDLMWEQDGESPLITFAIFGEPAVGQRWSAERLAPHRREYLEYEGEVFGGRGSVTRVHSGEVENVAGDDQRLELRLSSTTLSCTVVLDNQEDGWRATFSD